MAGEGWPVERTIRLRVRRSHPQRWETYEVPYEEGQTVLDALSWVRERLDASLAVRFACRTSNACKTCPAVVAGRNTYLCTHRLAGDELTLEPLPGRTLVRDLVVDL